ncbi:MAG: phenylacetate--CoA ligase family protein [Candidatus Aegiribacteria sp.]|nr:phenylacetate--CoA ligase family protein [Candidatus Aegiribacteria sp.]
MQKALLERIKGKFKRIFVPYTLRRYNSIYKSTQRHIRETERMSPKEIEQYHLRKLKDLIRYCRLNSPYYRRLFKSISFCEDDLKSIDDYRRIPVLTKKELKDNLDELSVQGTLREKASYGTTGGTTGEPVGYYSYKTKLQDIENAFVDDIWKRGGYSPGCQMAVMRGARINKAAKDGYFWRKYAGIPRLFLSTFHLDEPNANRYSELMSRYNVKYLHCFPSSALTFYKLLDKADAVKPKIDGILTSSEVLSDYNRKYIEKSADAPVLDLYGSSERVAIAGECPECGLYHVYPQYGYVELTDEHGTHIDSPGGVGSIIGTSYVRCATPLLRYELGDMAVFADSPGLCDRQYFSLERILGRQVEYVYSDEGREISMSLMNIHSDIFDSLIRFQFVQKKQGYVEFHYLPSVAMSIEEVTRIRRSIQNKLGKGFEVEMVSESYIPRGTNGKHRLLIQELKEFPAQ